jgi:arabinogalactan endo-1,4-beta-galactosidase
MFKPNQNMKRITIFFLTVMALLTVGCEPGDDLKDHSVQSQPGSASSADKTARASGLTYRGMDLSYAYKIETQRGGKFYNASGVQSTVFDIAKSSNVNLVRLRLWVNPDASHAECGIAAVKIQAAKIVSKGMQFMLTLHYSDYWADPGKQTIPAAWSSLSKQQLLDKIWSYTVDVMTQLKNQGTTPAIVQIGNEVNAGFLWPTFKVSADSDTNWDNSFEYAFNTGSRAVKSVFPQCKIMLHYAGIWGDNFFWRASKFGFEYDLMGFSWYPQWHGKSFTDLYNQLNNLTSWYSKSAIVVETAYPWTTGYADNASNVLNATSEISGYPITPAGQQAFLEKLMSTVKSIPGNRGQGVVYWEPDWTAYNGSGATNWENGSSWENVTLFDFSWKALQGFSAFN